MIICPVFFIWCLNSFYLINTEDFVSVQNLIINMHKVPLQAPLKWPDAKGRVLRYFKNDLSTHLRYFMIKILRSELLVILEMH